MGFFKDISQGAKMKKLITVFTFFLATNVVAATLHSLDKEKVTQLIKDHTLTTISTVTLNGEIQNNTFTCFLNKNGKIKGEFSQKLENDPQQDEGKWTVQKDGGLCFIWDNWGNGKQSCMYAYETKNMIIFVNKNGKFESAALKDEIKSGNQMS